MILFDFGDWLFWDSHYKDSKDENRRAFEALRCTSDMTCPEVS